jgi:hypothetical protein
MQVRQQIVNLLLREFLAVTWHFVSAEDNQITSALIVSRHSTHAKVLSLKNALQAGAFSLVRRISFVTSIAILIVDVPARGLLRIERKLGISFSTLNFTGVTE